MAGQTLPLTDLQANIIHSHGRDQSVCHFLKFNGDPASIREWIRTQVAGKVSTAQQQIDNIKQRRREKDKNQEQTDGGLVICFFLSAHGYRKLGIAEEKLPKDESFRMGMKRGRVNGSLADPPVVRWEEPYQNNIDAMILFADDHLVAAHLSGQVLGIGEVTSGGQTPTVELLHSEKGIKLMRESDSNSESDSDKKAYVVEHFGYRDNISQPDLLNKDGQFIGKVEQCFEDDNGKITGSYLVFRKLEQDVDKFNAAINAMAKDTGLTPEEVGQRVVGRDPKGSPLVESGPVSDDLNVLSARELNDFGFDGDPNGDLCPFHAHIRKANPRKGTNSVQIIRRGVPYGQRTDAEKGLLFMCFQASIEEQFEVIQKKWFNSVRQDFGNGKRFSGIDLVAGQIIKRDKEINEAHIFGNSPEEKEAQKLAEQFHGAVSMRGGEYFFAPLISFLENLDGEPLT